MVRGVHTRSIARLNSHFAEPRENRARYGDASSGRPTLSASLKPHRAIGQRPSFVNMLTPSVAFSLGGRGFRNIHGVPLMWKAVCTVALLVFVSVPAQAHHRHHHGHRVLQAMAFYGDAQPDERIVSNRPSGCPHAFCGCEASLYRFGRIIPQLNLASNWRRFPRATPAPGMAAVRSGHVMILQQQVSGNIWYVHDGNSGGHVTREHPRSIAGYTIVDPGAASFAQKS